MLRDIPKTMFLLIVFMFAFALSIIWFTTSFNKDSQSLDLTETVLSSALSEMDQTSRMYDGVYMVNDSFEVVVVESLDGSFGMDNATIEFDYMFDTEDSRFNNLPEFASTGDYKIGSKNPKPENMSAIIGKPVTAIRVRIDTDGGNRWTHTATVDVDIESKLGN